MTRKYIHLFSHPMLIEQTNVKIIFIHTTFRSFALSFFLFLFLAFVYTSIKWQSTVDIHKRKQNLTIIKPSLFFRFHA